MNILTPILSCAAEFNNIRVKTFCEYMNMLPTTWKHRNRWLPT